MLFVETINRREAKKAKKNMTSGGGKNTKVDINYRLICRNEVKAAKGCLKVKLEKFYHKELTAGEM